MSLKKMILLSQEIDRLQDENQRLKIEKDLLRQKIKAVATDIVENILTDVKVIKIGIRQARIV